MRQGGRGLQIPALQNLKSLVQPYEPNSCCRGTLSSPPNPNRALSHHGWLPVGIKPAELAMIMPCSVLLSTTSLSLLAKLCRPQDIFHTKKSSMWCFRLNKWKTNAACQNRQFLLTLCRWEKLVLNAFCQATFWQKNIDLCGRYSIEFSSRRCFLTESLIWQRACIIKGRKSCEVTNTNRKPWSWDSAFIVLAVIRFRNHK